MCTRAILLKFRRDASRKSNLFQMAIGQLSVILKILEKNKTMGLKRLIILHNLRQMWGRSAPKWMIMAFTGLSMIGCNNIPVRSIPPDSEIEVTALESCDKERCEVEREKLLAEKAVQQQEIERLQKLLAEKDALIRNQQVRQQDQAKTLQETSNQAAHVRKLRRLATRPAAASTIAEAEISMEGLTSSPRIPNVCCKLRPSAFSQRRRRYTTRTVMPQPWTMLHRRVSSSI